MQFTLFMAKRYLFSRKSHHLINIISTISVAGLAIGTAALIIILSVFNGFEQVITNLYNSINPDLMITAKQGKTFSTAHFPLEKIKNKPEVRAIVEMMEEDALFKYQQQQYIGKLRGYSANFIKVSHADTLIQDGTFLLQSGKTNYAVVGSGVAWILGINSLRQTPVIDVFVPKRGLKSSLQFENAFNSILLPVSGVFSVQPDMDQQYIFTSIDAVRKLMDYSPDIVSSLEIYLNKSASLQKIQTEIKNISGKKYNIKNRFEQNETLFKIMKSEKLAVFLILVFILLLTSFNMVGSVSLLIVEKIKDIAVLKIMGAEKRTIRRIFISQGMLITLTGTMAGLIAGLIILFLQQHFGIIKLGNGSGGFIIDAYPVHMKILDFIIVFFTVQVIGLLASWYPVHFLTKNFDKVKLS